MIFDWISVKRELPKIGKLYLITDGKDIALAKFDIEQMQWHFLWHYSVFKPTFMLEIIIPPLPA